MIFMGWPGQHEFEDDRAPAHRSCESDGMTGSGLLQLAQICLASCADSSTHAGLQSDSDSESNAHAELTNGCTAPAMETGG